MKIKNIIFDLGGVLIDWNPKYLFQGQFEGDLDKLNFFLDQVCTLDWNENQDAGYPIDKATEERIAIFPDHEKLIRMYYDRWEEMLGGPIQENVNLLKKIKKNSKYSLYALTNWSSETFPIALKRFEFLHLFEGIVVSGTEQTRKPFSKIYKIIMKRYNLIAEESLFIDDNYMNIVAARKLGFHTIHFQNYAKLKKEMDKKDILI